MDKEGYEFESWMYRRSKSHKWLDPTLEERTEFHHLFGQNNSDFGICICKNCHLFISSRQDTLSRADKMNQLLFALESIVGLLELAVAMLRWVCYKLKVKK